MMVTVQAKAASIPARRLRKPTYAYYDLDCKQANWQLRETREFFLGWEKRRPNGTLKPMWYARFGRLRVPAYCLTVHTIMQLPDFPQGVGVTA